MRQTGHRALRTPAFASNELFNESEADVASSKSATCPIRVYLGEDAHHRTTVYQISPLAQEQIKRVSFRDRSCKRATTAHQSSGIKQTEILP
jgi:hypothetical protein